MKEVFRNTNFRQDSMDLINKCDVIIAGYLRQGLRLTLRQLYYQLVTKSIIKNEKRAYSYLSRLVSDARLAGLLDWDAIEDRIRVPTIPSEWDNLRDLVKSSLDSYRLPRWKTQDRYVELWVEKDALAGVLRPLANKFHVPLMINRGFSSQSAMYESSKRFLEQDDKENILLYLGDFDPSGEDMVRDIRNRLELFGIDIEVQKIALIPEQIKRYRLPPNPVKHSDPRSKEFITKYGASSWEVDAIDPGELQRIITREINASIDQDEMNKVIAQEKQDKIKLTKAVEEIMQEKKVIE